MIIIDWLRKIESKMEDFLKSISWLNMHDDYHLFQAFIHFCLTWAITISFAYYNKWLTIIAFIYPLFKEFIFDKHLFNWKKETKEEHIDCYTDLLTNYCGFIVSMIIVFLK